MTQEKIEIARTPKNLFYTGDVEVLENGDLKIRTLYDETLVFRREQILQRKELSDTEWEHETKTAKGRLDKQKSL